ncbi:TonB-dependent receptor [Candidatus Palauibacter sp.]|uniref:TonB-dependent receptor n=1 Tax=Candidatus Palauibacter sp. TaxID=3101350 RepID=UPI003B01F4BA
MKYTTPLRTAAIVALAALGGLFAPTGARAQGVTTAAVNGRVTGQDLAPLASTVVTAVHGPSGTSYSTLTREDGRFNLPGMRVGGPYAITVELIGYQDESAEALVLALGENRRIDFVLGVQAVAVGEITVTAERGAILSSGRTGPQQTVTTREIESLPSIARSIQDFARLTPQALGTNIGSSENIGGVSIGGKNNRFNNISVDGAILNDVFGLPASGTPGGQANSQPISLDAVQEFQVAIAPFDIRQGGFTGGSINVITRSGTNDFDASGYVFGRNQGFTGALDENPLTDFSELQVGFRAGGPIQRDRIHFFTSGEIKQTSRPLALGLAGGSQLNNIALDASTINEIIDIANSAYGYGAGSFQEELQRDTDDFKLFGRLDFNLSDDHHLTVRHNHVTANSARGISRHSFEVGLPSQGYTFDAVSNSAVMQLDSRLGSSAANMFRVSYQRQRDKRTPDLAIFPEIDIEPIDGRGESVTLGIERFSQQNALDQDVFEITDDFTLFRGDHTLTLGTHNEFYSFSNLFIQDAFGQWEFEGETALEDFRNGVATRYRASISRLADPFPRAEWGAMQFGFYAQDQIDLSDRFNVTLGLRADIMALPDAPLENPNFAAAFQGRHTSDVPSGNVMWSPRIGFNAALDEDRTTQLRGGTGIFTGRNPFVWLSNQYSNTGMDFIRIDCRASRGCTLPPFTGNPNNLPRVPGAEIPTTEVDITDTNFKFPQAWRTTLGIDRELRDRLVLTVEGIYTKNVNDIIFRDLSIVPEGRTSDGRILFSDDAVDREFSPGVFLLGNTDRGRQVQFTTQLQKQFGGDFLPNMFGSLAYTWTDATDVNSGQSSRAISNFQYNEIGVDPNNPVESTAAFEVKHRFIASVSSRIDWSETVGTTITAFYEARAGRPFSWVYTGDANNDGRFSNDLAFVPGDAADAIFETECNGCLGFAAWDAFVSNVPDLNAARGGIVDRNSAREPWVRSLDLRIAQDLPLPGPGSQNIQVTLDFINVGNFFNESWGRQRYAAFGTDAILSFRRYDSDTGVPVVRFYQDDSNEDGVVDAQDVLNTDNILSRWAIQLGARISL